MYVGGLYDTQDTTMLILYTSNFITKNEAQTKESFFVTKYIYLNKLTAMIIDKHPKGLYYPDS